MREIRTEGQVWEVVSRKRRRRRKVNNIAMEEWDKYFKKLFLGGG